MFELKTDPDSAVGYSLVIPKQEEVIQKQETAIPRQEEVTEK